MNEKDSINIVIANEDHFKYTEIINDTIQHASEERGTGIARRTDEYIIKKMQEGKTIIALDGETFAGFCYVESWGHNRFVANSGLIVAPRYRGMGLAKRIKKMAFERSRELYPDARIFGLTTGLPVMKINSELGYRPVTFSELADDEEFWKGCQSCVNYDILLRTERTKCLCTAMIFDPKWEKKETVKEPEKEAKKDGKVIPFEKWLSREQGSGYASPLKTKLKLLKKQ